MPDSRTRCAQQIHLLQEAIAQINRELRTRVAQALAALAAAPDIALTTTDQLLREVLRPATRRVEQAAASLAIARTDALWRRLFSVRDAKRGLAIAMQAREQAQQSAQRSDEVERRQAEVARRSAQHRNHVDSQNALSHARELQDVVERDSQALLLRLRPIAEAIARGAWLAADTEALLESMVEHIRLNRWSQAEKALRAISVQTLPSESRLKQWRAECEAFLARVQAQRVGFSALAPFQGLVDPGLELAERRSHPGPWDDAMRGLSHWSDRWHALPRALTAPLALVEPFQWIVYWTFLTESQAFAEVLGQATPHEDVLTGILAGLLGKQLRGWAKERLLELGYPRATAELDFVPLAGQKGEARTGADVGFIIHVQVGDLRVHKVALLQAKVSNNGAANIGSLPSGPSNRTQLQKLRDPDRDFFLFYHASSGASPAALPTVTPVGHFLRMGRLDEVALARSRITVDTRQCGWDLASFVAFGLCNPANTIGRDVPAGADPLEVMTSGGRSALPACVVVISLSDDEHGCQHVLSLLDRQRYRPGPRERTLVLKKEKAQDEPTYDGPQFG